MAAAGHQSRRQWLWNLLFSSLVMLSTLALPPPSQAKSSSGASTIPTTTTTKRLCLDSNGTLPIIHDTAEKTRTRTKKRHHSESNHAITATKRPKQQQQQVHKRKETGSREAACLRRIKREWRDAVKLGIAYDWMQMKTLSSNNNKTTSENHHVRIGPLHKNLLQWHFSVMGPPNSEYEGGVYHGRVLLPKTYPASPPRIQVYTPSGRFIPGSDICLSASSFHPESWTPQWTILSLVESLRLHMLTTANEIGGKDDTPQQRRAYARASRTWSRGRIHHEQMIQQGMFATDTHDLDKENQVEVETSSSDGGGVKMMAVKQQQQQQQHWQTRDQVVKRVPPKLSTVVVRAVVQVLTSPPRIALLFLVTVFIILNRR